MGASRQAPSLSERQVERIEVRLRRVFWGSFGLTALMILLMLWLAPRWGTQPPTLRFVFPAMLLWSLLVTAYGFHSQTCASDEAKERLRARSFVDDVTGVFNFRYLDLRLAEEAERTRRHGGLTALLYIDLDGFKQVNDQFGHQVGDTVLEQIASAMTQRVRSCDVLGRAGGDEFLVVLPQTDRREAYVLAERLREGVQSYVLALEGGRVVDTVRASIGVAAYPVNGETMDNVITAASNSVVMSKEQGGNRVTMADEFITTDLISKQILDSVRGPHDG
jgi:diguanylate cyclase (GGDEF)-like protein